MDDLVILLALLVIPLVVARSVNRTNDQYKRVKNANAPDNVSVLTFSLEAKNKKKHSYKKKTA